jgi:hypothetical protein
VLRVVQRIYLSVKVRGLRKTSPMKYQERNAKDSQILIGLAKLSLPDGWKRVKDLEASLREARESLEKNRKKKTHVQTCDFSRRKWNYRAEVSTNLGAIRIFTGKGNYT